MSHLIVTSADFVTICRRPFCIWCSTSSDVVFSRIDRSKSVIRSFPFLLSLRIGINGWFMKLLSAKNNCVSCSTSQYIENLMFIIPTICSLSSQSKNLSPGEVESYLEMWKIFFKICFLCWMAEQEQFYEKEWNEVSGLWIIGYSRNLADAMLIVTLFKVFQSIDFLKSAASNIPKKI